MSGIGFIIFFGIDILKNMKEEGNFDLSLLLALNIMNVFNALVSFGGMSVQAYIGQRKTALLG